MNRSIIKIRCECARSMYGHRHIKASPPHFFGTLCMSVRPAGRTSFFSYEHVLGTMLHELTHMEVGPHNKQFYKVST